MVNGNAGLDTSFHDWSVFDSNHSGGFFSISSKERKGLFWKNKISVTTSVPAMALNAVFGKRTIPTKSACLANSVRKLLSCLSIVPDEVITATIPPECTKSNERFTK